MDVTSSIAMVAAGAMSAGSSFMGGRAESRALKDQAEFNAQNYEQQAALVAGQKKVNDYHYRRKIGRMRGAHVAGTAARGITFSGSPLRVMADTESQLLYDQAVDNYNLKVQENYYRHGAEMTRYEGGVAASEASRRGTMNAFSTLLSTGGSVAGMNFGGGSPKPDIYSSSGPGYRNFGSIPGGR